MTEQSIVNAIPELIALAEENRMLSERIERLVEGAKRCDKQMEAFKAHLNNLNRAVDALGPQVARAITKLTPPSISIAYQADFEFARELRVLLDKVTYVQNEAIEEEK